MHIRIGYDLRFDVPAPTPMHLLLHAVPFGYTFVEPEQFVVEPAVPFEMFVDHFGNRCTRLLAPSPTVRFTSTAIVEDTGLPDDQGEGAFQHPVLELPFDTLQFLMSSRYCEVDKLSEFAWQQFGGTPLGWPRVKAIIQFVHDHLTFGYPFARNTRTAFEGFEEKKGVCRDFAHLSIALCRCMGIPARYATGYLGDIGIPFNPDPMDFSAWLEVYLGHRWYTLDARHVNPRIGRIVMARGRDAADTALTTSFGPTNLTYFFVVSDEIK